MASRKLVRDLLLSRQPQLRQSLLWQFRQRLTQAHDAKYLGYRQFGVFNEFKKQVKGEATSNSEFQKSIKELNEKVGGLKDGLKTRTKQTTEKIYKQVDGIWTEAESATKKVSASVKEKLSAATEEVKESFRVGKDQPASSSSTATKSDVSGRNDTASDAESFNSNDPSKSSESNWQSATIIGKIKSAISPKVSEAYMKLKEANMTDLAKKGYNIVKDELNASSSKRRKMHNTEPASTIERSTRTDIVIVPSNKSRVGKKWEEFKEKMRGHPVFKRISGISEPVVAKSQELAEDVRERWETSDHPVVHKIQDLNETVFGETATALSFKEIRRRDPSFSLPEFVAEVQEMVKPTLTAYMKGDVEILKKYCSPEVIERCKGERMAYESQGYFFDNKILHISDVQVTDTKMMGSSPVIILVFQTQQIYCMRDREGSIIDGGKDSIQSVFYAWAMQLVDSEELGEEVFYPKWRLREMQQSGVQALI